jgi:hypothetical protein
MNDFRADTLRGCNTTRKLIAVEPSSDPWYTAPAGAAIAGDNCAHGVGTTIAPALNGALTLASTIALPAINFVQRGIRPPLASFVKL